MMKEGVFIISLDFELHWGVFEKVNESSPYMENLRNTPDVIERTLQVFKKRQISATWATVGFLFAENDDMRKKFEPRIKPNYKNANSNPYLLNTGKNENEDPIHYAHSLIKKIKSTPGQEIATHTFSHFFCREESATIEAFNSDLESAIKIAKTQDQEIYSIVFPRNQLIQEYIDLLPKHGIKVFRGAEKGWMYTGIKANNRSKLSITRQKMNKAGRIVDSYLPITGSNTWSVSELSVESGKPINVPASLFLRPYNPRLKNLDWLKYKRIKNQIKHAARNGKMVHLRWHPHNFGSYADENIAFLEKILDFFEECRSEYKMKSITMYEYADFLEKTNKPTEFI